MVDPLMIDTHCHLENDAFVADLEEVIQRAFDKGIHIPLGARIMGVVGAFEAMITKKYREPLSIQEAINEIKKNSSIQFDPKVVEAFLKIIKRKDMLNLLKKEIYATKKTHK